MNCKKVGNDTICTDYDLKGPQPNQLIKGTVQGEVSCSLSCFGKHDYNWKEDICTCKNKQVVPWWYR